jgi:hypothetical protein
VAERQIDRAQVAKLCGFTDAGHVSKYVLRGRRARARGEVGLHLFPEPDGLMGRSPWWWESTIDRYMTHRRGRGQPVEAWTDERRRAQAQRERDRLAGAR